jgi:hypothetical protein
MSLLRRAQLSGAIDGWPVAGQMPQIARVCRRRKRGRQASVGAPNGTARLAPTKLHHAL